MKVIDLGSINIDYVYEVDHFAEKGETIASSARAVYAGGKGLNQSIALARAGLPVEHVGCVGSEGSFLLEKMKAAGVSVQHVEIVNEHPSGHAIIQHDKEGDNCIVLFGGANQHINHELVDDALKTCTNADWLLLQNETSSVPYAIQEAHEVGMKVVFNPSPITEDLFEYPLDLVDYFVLNEIEAEYIVGKSGSPEELAVHMSDLYPRAQIILTAGSYGSVWMHKDGDAIVRPAIKTQVVDTTAAGDTFTGYLLASIIRGKEITECLHIATAAASLAVSQPGASPSIPLYESVTSFIKNYPSN